MESRNTNSFLSPNETGDGYHSKSSDSGAALALAALRSDSERRPSSKACGGMTKEYADKVGSAKAEASARRCSSLGLTLMTEFDLSGFETSAAPLSSGNPNLPEQIHSTPNEMSTQLPYRPMVGSGTADAFEALRHDFYVQQQQQKLIAKQKRRMSSLSFGSAKGSVGYTQNGNNRSAHEEE